LNKDKNNVDKNINSMQNKEVKIEFSIIPKEEKAFMIQLKGLMKYFTVKKIIITRQ